MAVLASFLPQGSSRQEKTAVQRLQRDRHDYLNNCARTVALVGKGSWPAAVNIAIDSARLTQADLARELGVTRSTVMRWASGEAEPLPEATGELLDALVAAIRRQAA